VSTSKADLDEPVAPGHNGIMQRFRKLATIVLVWATASSTLLAAAPYYRCRCPDGTLKTHFVGAASPDASCCSTNCCAVETNDKPCCQAKKKKQPVKASRSCRAGDSQQQNCDGSPQIGQVSCQKTLVQPDVPAVVQADAGAESGHPVTLLSAKLPGFHGLFEGEAETTIWRIDKAPPPTDLVTILQRLTI
jgi:hypothetical protein